MIVITGAAGFIGSNLLSGLNNEGFKDIVLVDDFSSRIKEKNYINKTFSLKIHRDDFFAWLPKHHRFIQFIFHIGARTDTAEFDRSVFNKLNYGYSQKVWNLCVEYGLPLIYTSSAATYGLGEFGFKDDHDLVKDLKPLNPYGESKNDFDKWVLEQKRKPYFWAGLKLFNVYGPNEYHKDRMASVIFHTYNQIKETGKMKLFRSHNPEFRDGEQKRDFVYVSDVVNVMCFLMNHRKDPGIYNVGTGRAGTFLGLTGNTFSAMGLKTNIEYIDTPEDIRDKYQYFTQAEMDKLRSVGYTKPFHTLDEGIEEYVKTYLKRAKYI